MAKQKITSNILKDIQKNLDCSNSSEEFKFRLNQIVNCIALLYIKDQKRQKGKHLNVGMNLTKREYEILFGIAMERTNEVIAKNLGIKKRTVDTHRIRLLKKLQVKNTAGLVRVAFQKGIFK
jgi:DNA-binding NarL/FixJ family response regulator